MTTIFSTQHFTTLNINLNQQPNTTLNSSKSRQSSLILLSHRLIRSRTSYAGNFRPTTARASPSSEMLMTPLPSTSICKHQSTTTQIYRLSSNKWWQANSASGPRPAEWGIISINDCAVKLCGWKQRQVRLAPCVIHVSHPTCEWMSENTIICLLPSSPSVCQCQH